MTHKALIRRLQISCLGLDPIDPLRLLVDDVIEALRENAMREVQRLGQEIEQEPEQEPRNVRERWNVELDGNDLLVCFNDHEKGDKCQYERYSPQRTWVGLTDEEKKDLCRWWSSPMDAIYATEAKLKEKNT